MLTLVLGSLLAGLAILLASGEYRWRARTSAALTRLRRPGAARVATVYAETELKDLPAPVARYFREVLKPGQPIVRYARFSQRGTFLVRPPDGWRPFAATHHAVTLPAGFVWDARIRAAPGLSFRVRDSFIDGTGSMFVTVMGLVGVVSVEGTPEMASGALHRYLAEAAWFPSALLPSQGVVWAPIDDASARATLTVGGTTVWLDVHFGADGFITRVYTPARARDVNGRGVPTPWQGRFSRYEERNGMKIPVIGEVEWVLPEGPQPYWRGEITEMAFEAS
jgi:hypothetical protein